MSITETLIKTPGHHRGVRPRHPCRYKPTGQIHYQFVPGGERYHVVAPAITQTGAAK